MAGSPRQVSNMQVLMFATADPRPRIWRGASCLTIPDVYSKRL